jgi:CheY-like chemotaxis protein
MVLEFAERLLTRAGYRVLLARSAEEALDRYRENRSDIRAVVVDLSLPGMDGLECLNELRRLDPSVPVLITSGAIDETSRREARSRGAQGVLPKPFDLRHALDTLRATLDSSCSSAVA